MSRALMVGLALTDTLLGVALPPVAAGAVRADPAAHRLARQIGRTLFQHPSSRGAFETCLLHLRAADSYADRLSYLARVALLPTADDWVFSGARNASSVRPCLLRPARLALKYVRSSRRAESIGSASRKREELTAAES
jgi:hypothetical protein